jgi:hypothetical protein
MKNIKQISNHSKTDIKKPQNSPIFQQDRFALNHLVCLQKSPLIFRRRNGFQKMLHCFNMFLRTKFFVQLFRVRFFAWLLGRSRTHQITQRLNRFRNQCQRSIRLHILSMKIEFNLNF